jgi:hypothetical protein
MVCRNCGATIAEKAIVCYRCGAPTALPVLEQKPSPSSRRGLSTVVVVVLVVLAAVIYFFTR